MRKRVGKKYRGQRKNGPIWIEFGTEKRRQNFLANNVCRMDENMDKRLSEVDSRRKKSAFYLNPN